MFRYEEPPRKVLVREATEHFNRAMMMTIYSLKCTNLLLINQKRNECHNEFVINFAGVSPLVIEAK